MDLNTNIPKEVSDKALEALELARKGGKLKKGVNEVTKAVERGITLVPVPTKEDLGKAAGLGIPTAAVAIIQEGEAKQAIKELTSKLKA